MPLLGPYEVLSVDLPVRGAHRNGTCAFSSFERIAFLQGATFVLTISCSVFSGYFLVQVNILIWHLLVFAQN